MAEPYQLPVARIRNGDGHVVGAGFAAPRGVIVTCAHVVNDALGRDQLDQRRPGAGDVVHIDLPWAGGHYCTARIIEWRQPQAPGVGGNPCIDIAVLRPDPEAPTDCAVVTQAPTAVPEKTLFRVMGFPADASDGAPFRGQVRGSDARGWHHVDAEREHGQTLEPGFSGAPAIADDGRPLGMVDIVNSEERSGVLIPVEALMRAWPPLAEPYRGLDAFREEDAAYFFGRQAFKDRLWRSFERHPVTLLVGPSGSGKSSLLNAGFLPRLRHQPNWRILRMRPGDRPIDRLADEIVFILEPEISLLRRPAAIRETSQQLLKDPAVLLDFAISLQRATHTESV